MGGGADFENVGDPERSKKGKSRFGKMRKNAIFRVRAGQNLDHPKVTPRFRTCDPCQSMDQIKPMEV